MAWFEVYCKNNNSGGSGLDATEIIVLSAEYTSEPLPVEQENS